MSSSNYASYPYADTTQQLLPTSSRNLTHLTTLGQKYSHPVKIVKSVSHSILASTGKSGLTPLPRKPLTLRDKQLYNYQKRRFHGFSIEELAQLEALAAESEEKVERGEGLSNPIHPLYRRAQWETRGQMGAHVGPVPVRGDEGGFWMVDNDKIWNLLEPCLQLASRMLTHAHLYPWWDALLNGPLRPIASHRIPPGHEHLDLMSFHARPPNIWSNPSVAQYLHAQIIRRVPAIRFRLVSGYGNTFTGLCEGEMAVCASTGSDVSARMAMVSIAADMLQPLLRGDLTEAERIVSQFKVATTILHETAHAFWIVKASVMRLRKLDVPDHEPYFEDEVLAELGWSIEHKLWGGEPSDILHPHYARGGPGLPPAGFFKTNWFTDIHEFHHLGPPALSYITALPATAPDPFYVYEYYPVPVTWPVSLFSEDLWTGPVASFGSGATKMGACAVGSIALYDNDDVSQNPGVVTGSESENKYRGRSDADVRDGLRETLVNKRMSNAVASRIMFENSRRARASLLYNNMGYLRSELPVPDPKEVVGVGDEDVAPPHSCSRWDEIAKYLVDNRAPGELALDTMDFPMPEQNMFRYILDRGGLVITAVELREFLHVASEKQQLFSYAPLPGHGTLRRIPPGWPTVPKPFNVPLLARAQQIHVYGFNLTMRSAAFREQAYATFGEYRDIDFEHLGRFLNQYISNLSEHIPERDIKSLVCRRIDEGNHEIGLGPEGVARMRWPIEDAWRTKYQGDFEKGKMANDDVVEKIVVDAEAKRIAAEAKIEDERTAKNLKDMDDSGVADMSGLVLEGSDSDLDSESNSDSSK